MIISFIGMSGAGKTRWSRILEKEGFVRYSVDDMIEDKLGSELTKLGYHGIHDLAKWMGYPYESRYTKNSQRYLQLEKESVLEILDVIKTSKRTSNIVVDTTGSLVYLSPQVIQKVRQNTFTVYLEVPKSATQQMFDLFMKKPKPVIWGNNYIPMVGEEPKDALSRCYQDLLEFRSNQYARYAFCTISSTELQWSDYNTNALLMRLFAEEKIYKSQITI